MSVSAGQSPAMWAQAYARRRWGYISVPFRSKKPVTEGWQELRLGEAEIEQTFNGQPQNVSVLLGEPSDGLIDTDLDAPEAVKLASYFLEPTDCRFGRTGKPNSHWLYSADPLEATTKFQDPDGTMLVEYRSTGAQTVFPGSVHPSGEPIEWAQFDEPLPVNGRILKANVAHLASAALLARHWPTLGSRQDASLALAGGLLHAGWQQEDVEHFIHAVGVGANDEELADRVKAAAYTKKRIEKDQTSTGWPTLARLIGNDVIDRATQWLDISKREPTTTPPPVEPSQAEPKWETRQELPSGTPNVPTLSAEMIPEPLRSWLVDIASRVCMPIESVVCPALVALGSLVGRTVGIRPGTYDDFIVVPNLWGADIARPGAMKSNAIKEATKPLTRLEAIAHDRGQAEEDSNEAGKERATAEINAIKGEMARLAKDARDPSATSATPPAEESSRKMSALEAELARKLEDLRRSAPIAKRYVTQDATVEKLGELLNENPRGLLVLRDELSGWLRSFDKSGHESDREFYLEGWDGTGGFTVDRIGRGTIRVEALTISIFGGIQPGKLATYVRGAIEGNEEADGLLQRLQMSVWPDGLGPWVKPKKWPDAEAKNRAFEIFRLLDDLDPDATGAERLPDTERAIPFLRFDPTAQEISDTWRDELEYRLRSDELISTPAFESHLAKYRSLMPSLALLFHLIEIANSQTLGPVTEVPTRLAAAWCDFLEAHARKIYAPELYPSVEAANSLANKIGQGVVTDGQTVREIYQHHWSGLTNTTEVDAALDVLGRCGWVRIETLHTNGRPTEILRLHPDLRAGQNE